MEQEVVQEQEVETSPDLTQIETLLEETNEHLQTIEGATVSTVALLGLLAGIVLGIAVARLFYSLWKV